MLTHPRSALVTLLLGLAACTTTPDQRPRVAACPPCAPCPACPGAKPEVQAPALSPGSFADLPGWREDDPSQAWGAFLASCSAVKSRAPWQNVCARAAALGTASPASIRAFFESSFVPYRVANGDGATTGLVTGYYEPLLRGSRDKRAPYVNPLYAPPDDLLVIDLASINPDLQNMRLRGRLDGKRVVPYFSRAEIEGGKAPVAGKEIVFVDDPIEAFFLQIQGSGRVRLENGELLRVGYADQNGHPYRSIGRYLVDRGELPLSDASMQGIAAWARANPRRLSELLDANPSYVFFRELPNSEGGPLGALGVPLTPERSIAVDPRFVPLGAPVWLATTRPNAVTPLQRLVVAQDTGGAIRGAVRADFFWGFGPAAGQAAGRMRQEGRLWVLLPRGYPIGANGTPQ